MNTALLVIVAIGIALSLSGLVVCGYLLYKSIKGNSELEGIVKQMEQVDKELKRLLKEK